MHHQRQRLILVFQQFHSQVIWKCRDGTIHWNVQGCQFSFDRGCIPHRKRNVVYRRSNGTAARLRVIDYDEDAGQPQQLQSSRLGQLRSECFDPYFLLSFRIFREQMQMPQRNTALVGSSELSEDRKRREQRKNHTRKKNPFTHGAYLPRFDQESTQNSSARSGSGKSCPNNVYRFTLLKAAVMESEIPV